jgi:hypothetical protein
MPPIKIAYRYRKGPLEVFYSSSDEVILGRLGDAVSESPQHTSFYLDLGIDPGVSRIHARLTFDLGTWWVEDLGSSNGTFLNGKTISGVTALATDDTLQVGATTLRVQIPPVMPEFDDWVLVGKQEIDEAEPPLGFPEDRRLEILAAVSRQAAHARDRSALVAGVLRELAVAFPKAERKTILLVEDGELVADVFWPPDRSYVSFTLAHRAIKSRQVVLWARQAESGAPPAESLADTVSALYAPMLCGGEVVGAIHLDSTAVGTVFDKRDLDILAVIANTAGPALRSARQGGFDDFPSAFISYARENRVFVNRLTADLRRRRIKVWFDERLKSGEPWQDQISMAIARTDACIVIISPHSLASEQVENELRTALAMSRTILPVMLEGSVSFGLIEALQYIDFKLGYDDGLSELAERINELRQGAIRER